MTPEQYHADPCPLPSLSSSIAQILLQQSPMHARAAHPRLNPQLQRESSRTMSIGSVAHKLVLGKGADVVVIEADSYRTKAAQEQRDAAEASGRIAVLTKDYDAAIDLSAGLRERVEEYMQARVEDCLTEHVIMWEEGGQWRRAMLDIVSKDLRRIGDVKTTAMSASAQASGRQIFNMGYHIQTAFYLRAADAKDPDGIGKRKFGFIFGEQSSPYAVSPPIELSESALDIGRKAVAKACALWDECMATGIWPGYSRETHIAEPPMWLLSQQEVES